MNWIDRAVSYMSPIAGLRRQQARKALDRTAPAQRSTKRFAGRDRDFYKNTGDPNDARPRTYIDRVTILRLIAENPFARKALHAMLNSLIGWGITGAPSGSAKLKKMWFAWIKVCDFGGRLDLYGLQKLWAISMLRDGEVFIVQRFVKAPAGEIPLRLQTFDKGMLASHLTGDNLHRGIEYDADGRAIAYHFYRGRRGQPWSSMQTVRFAAEDVIHLFDNEWVGQTEGVSIFEPVVKRLGDVDEGIEAEVVKANIAACLVGFRYRTPDQEGGDPNVGLDTDEDVGGAPVQEFVPGMIETLDDGEQITFSNPPRTGGIGDLARLSLLAASAGVGVTYEQMTGDLSNVNYSSYRAGLLEFKRYIGRLQWLTFIPICLDRVFGWFVKAGSDFAILPKSAATMKWTPPPFESLDRIKDAKADILEMEAGLENRPNLLASRGYDHDEFLADTADSIKKSNALDLKFKGDPSIADSASASAKTTAAAEAA